MQTNIIANDNDNDWIRWLWGDDNTTNSNNWWQMPQNLSIAIGIALNRLSTAIPPFLLSNRSRQFLQRMLHKTHDNFQTSTVLETQHNTTRVLKATPPLFYCYCCMPHIRIYIFIHKQQQQKQKKTKKQKLTEWLG